MYVVVLQFIVGAVLSMLLHVVEMEIIYCLKGDSDWSSSDEESSQHPLRLPAASTA